MRMKWNNAVKDLGHTRQFSANPVADAQWVVGRFMTAIPGDDAV